MKKTFLLILVFSITSFVCVGENNSSFNRKIDKLEFLQYGLHTYSGIINNELSLDLTNPSVSILESAQKNGYVISSKQRQDILDSIDNAKLKSMFNELYRPGATVPDGGTAWSIIHTKKTGELVGGSDHVSKGNSYLNALRNLVSGNGKYENEILSSSDRQLASKLIEDLKYALNY